MRKKCKLVAVLVVICMVATLLPFIPMEEYEASEKVSSELLTLMDVTYEDLTEGNFVDSGEKYSCIIWIQDVEIEEAVEAGIDAAEMTRDDYSVWSLYDYPYTTYEADGLTYVEVDFDENESDEYVQTYIEAEREAAAELYSANNSSFVAENFMARDMSVEYVSQYSPCVFADLSIAKVAELVEKNDVICIEFWNDENEEPEGVGRAITDAEIQDRMEIIRADEAFNVYGVTGDGVKIGQIETTCPSATSVTKSSTYNATLDAGVYKYHADNVYKIMSTVAPDSTYYAISRNISNTSVSKGSFYEQVEWLLSQGVNIINMSMGFSGENNVNKYTSRAKWMDHIAYNHDVHVVKSAGNSMNSAYSEERGVSCPGMAYNIITVGNTYSTSAEQYLIRETSSYNHDGYSTTTYKPDIVAPGVYYNANGAVDISGTSFAAPLVTGTIALMCEYKPQLKVQQHLVKAILAARTSKSIYRYVTTDSNFEIYGAGMLDTRSAIDALNVKDYVSTTEALTTVGSIKSYTMKVVSSDTRMRVALAYANRIEYGSDEGTHSSSEIPNGDIGRLDIEVYDPNGNKVAYIYSSGLEREANIKVLEFATNGVYGNYTIKVRVTKAASNGKTINYGLAWR